MSELRQMLLGTNQRASLEAATAAYQEQMNSECLEYLENRGIPLSVALKARLGVVSDPIPGHENYKGRLCIPYLTQSGVVGLKFRDLKNTSRVKYLMPDGQRPRLYNVNDLHVFSRYIVICEGELDALVMSQVVGMPAVGVAGTSMWYPHMAKLFEDYERVYLVIDNDGTTDEDGEPTKGQGLARKIGKDVKGSVNIAPPEGHDINSWYLSEGAEAVRKGVLG